MSGRNTIQRQLVMDAVTKLHNHPTAEEIYAYVAGQYPSVSRGTVYRNLGALADAGEIRRVSHLDAADRFDFELTPHYHFHCQGCGRVFDAEMDYDFGLMDRLKQKAGFVYNDYDITFTGLCPACAKQTSTTGANNIRR